jgi:hypothetical protein
MNYNRLLRLSNGGALMINERTFSGVRKTNADFDVEQQSIGMKQQEKPSAVFGGLVFAAGLGDGLWIPYLAKRTVYDFLTGGQSWFASGPFSGCWFEVGRANGRFYAAHISCEGSNDGSKESFVADPGLGAREVLFSERIRTANNFPQGCFPQAIVFASIKGAKVEVVRVDIQGKDYGSLSGEVFSVTKMT